MAKQIYLFYGDEEFLIQERIKQLKQGLPDPCLNIEQLDGAAPELEKIIAALQTQPMLLGDKLLIIKDVDLTLPLWGEIAPALATLWPGLTVVFQAKTIDRRTKIFKTLDKLGEVYEFKSFAPWEAEQVVRWIEGRVKRSNKSIDTEAAVELREICGHGLMKLAIEIDKLITYIGDRDRIELADIKQLASPGEVSVFDLSEAVADRDSARALLTWRGLLNNKVEIFPILSLLAKQFRTMLLIKTTQDTATLARVFNLSPYYLKKCAAKAGNFIAKEMVRALELILETDLKIKNGENQSLVMELLLSSLCHG